MSDYAVYPSLKNRVVYITGGATGIGGNMVRLFAAQGAKVAFLDIDERLGKANVDWCTAQGYDHTPLFLQGDVRDIPRLEETIDQTIAHFGPLQVLINNAANDDRHSFGEVTPEYWDERFAINLRHQYFAIQKAAPSMRECGGGSIINIGSSSWMIKEDVFPAYAVAKSAVQGLTHTLARTLGVDNIRVNTVLPGWVVTDRQLEKWWSEEGELRTLGSQCLKKRIYPEEFNQMVLFLAADDGWACTSQSYIVDGGRAGL